MKIGELATTTDTPVETIRYYEKQGLLPAPGRTQGNYRHYGPEHVERLQFIRHCRSLDMSLDEARTLLKLRDQPQDGDCREVDALLDEHIGHVSQRIRELKQLERQLKTLRGQCHAASEAGRCGILAGLSDSAPTTARPGGGAGHLASVHRGPPRRRA